MSSLLELSKQLGQLSADSLANLVKLGSSNISTCSDLLDLSRSLLSRRELEARIRTLSADELRNLRAGQTSAKLKSLALAGENIYEEALALALELEPVPYKPSASYGSSLSAYETMLCITELLFLCERHWLGVIRAGIRSQDAKEVAQKLKLQPKEVQLRFQLGLRAGLIAEQHGRWVATEKGLRWLELDRTAAWLELAAPLWNLPELKIEQGSLSQQIRDAYPLVDLSNFELLEFGAFLGLLDGDQVLPAMLAGDIESVAKKVVEQLPKAEDRLIVQGDLTIICPGPISPQLHRELDCYSDSEDLGLAARFRVSALTLSHAVEIGLELDEVMQDLEKRSGKALPQPFSYLIDDVKRRFGQLRVLVGEAGTIVESEDSILITQIKNEARLNGLMLTKITENQLASRLDAEMIYFNLRDAGYLAVMYQDGKLLSPRFRGAELLASVEKDPVLETCERLLAGKDVVLGEDDVTRQLQFALKNKLLVRLKVELQDGSTQEFELAPLGIAANRLRGKDLEKEAERTLPISRIRGVTLV